MRILIGLVPVLALMAQTPKATVAYTCAPEDIETAGLTCTPSHPCPVYLELSQVEILGSRYFLSGNLHTSDATLTSVLLSSEDGSRTWTEPARRINGAGVEQMQFIDYQNGWVGGQLLQGRPRDPFVLVTRDGGKSWTWRPLFEESRTGILQTFWFETKDQGTLIVDRMQPSENGSRYEMYETQTGGDNWSLKELSARPMKISKSRAGQGNPDWRIRADAGTKTYVVEQRQGQRWQGVTIFPIQVAECKGEELKLAEPEPEAEPVAPVKTPAPAVKKRKKN